MARFESFLWYFQEKSLFNVSILDGLMVFLSLYLIVIIMFETLAASYILISASSRLVGNVSQSSVSRFGHRTGSWVTKKWPSELIEFRIRGCTVLTKH